MYTYPNVSMQTPPQLKNKVNIVVVNPIDIMLKPK